MKQLSILALSSVLAASIAWADADPKRLPERPKGPKATVAIHAAVDSIVPGQAFDVAVAFKIVPGWHIYWQNPGDSGLPPRIQWTGPEGFTAGPIQFPVPKPHRDAGGLTTNILEGEPVLIVSVQAPESISARSVTLEAKVNYLVCEAACLQESATLRLTLPVQAAGGAAKPANEELFAAAGRKLPKSSSKYVTVTPELPGASLTKDQKFDYVVKVKIKPGHHIQSDKPLNPQFIATTLLIEAHPTILWKPSVFPEAKVRELPGVGKVSEFAGEIAIRVPGEAYEDIADAKRIGGLLTYQACTDAGTCFPPETVAFAFADAAPPPRAPMQTAAAGGAADGGGAPREATAGAESPTSESPEPAIGERSPLPASTCDWPVEVVEVGASAHSSLWFTILFAALGGLILNVMPCVLPVISIKILSFVRQASEHPRRVLLLGLTFAAGIVVSFEILAVVALILQGLGKSAGWGSQFQSPAFVIFMATIMFVFGLSLLGVFEVILPGSATQKLSETEAREGLVGAFFKGVLATVLATPCTAPFLGSAMGVAFASNSKVALVGIFTAAGVGMAFPYILLAAHPAWMKYLPKPGPWMEHFKEFMGLLLMGTFVWLMVILGDLLGGAGVAYTLCFLTFVGAACWLIGKSSPLLPTRQRLLLWTGSLALFVAGWFTSYRWLFRVDQAIEDREQLQRQAEYWAANHPEELFDLPYDQTIPWKRWLKCLPKELAAKGYTVYVDYTATWCATCQTNKKVTLESDAVRQRMKELKIIPLKADYTDSDPGMFEEIQKFGRAGVPTNIIIPACDPNRVLLLPEQLVGQTDLILAQMEAAGPSRPDACEQTASR